MEKPFIFNPNINSLDLKDAIDERYSKLRGVLNCLIFAIEFTQEDQELDNSSAYHALWAIDGFLEEVDYLRKKLDDMTEKRC
jgi:hypothetical protein